MQCGDLIGQEEVSKKVSKKSEEGKANQDRIEVGYAWRSTLADFASLSGVFAGFAIAFIALLLGLDVARAPIPYVSGLSWASLGIVFIGPSVGLFVGASQFFLQAKACDMRSIPMEFSSYLTRELSKEAIAFEAAAVKNDASIRSYEARGRYCYNAAVLLVLIGLGLIIMPYSWPLAIFVLVVCMLLEAYEYKVIS